MQPPPPFPIALLAESEDAGQVLRHTEETLNQFAVPFVAPVLRGRNDLTRIVPELDAAGVQVFIVADSSPAALSVVVSGLTLKPVLSVPEPTANLPPLDALCAATAVGAPVATLAIGKPGAINAALLAIAILANADRQLADRLEQFRADQTARVLADSLD
jgi:5-(carboxyamino)imidazole ribonucleotide mutase